MHFHPAMLHYRRASVLWAYRYKPPAFTLSQKQIWVQQGEISSNTNDIEPFDYMPPEIIRHILSYIDEAFNVLVLGDRIDIHQGFRPKGFKKTIAVLHGMSLHIIHKCGQYSCNPTEYGTLSYVNMLDVVDGKLTLRGTGVDFVECGLHSGMMLHTLIDRDIDRQYRDDDLVEDWRKEWEGMKKYPLIYECTVGRTEYYRSTIPRDTVIDLSCNECPHENRPVYSGYGDIYWV